MNLEDHIGEVIRKAREAVGVSLENAAKAASLSASELSALEQTGQCAAETNLKALAKLVDLHPAKLLALAKGWSPQQPDVSQWRELRRITTTRDGITVNCYLAWDEVTRETALFDTGWEAGPILALVTEHGLDFKHLFLTHTHEDHIAAMGKLRAAFPKLRLHTNSKNAPPQHRNRANDIIHLGSLRITHRETPGHAEDGVIYLIGKWPEEAPHVALVGDTVFAGSLATGLQSTELLKKMVREQIFSLPQETLICPGHGPFTTVEQEKMFNPFFA